MTTLNVRNPLDIAIMTEAGSVWAYVLPERCIVKDKAIGRTVWVEAGHVVSHHKTLPFGGERNRPHTAKLFHLGNKTFMRED